MEAERGKSYIVTNRTKRQTYDQSDDFQVIFFDPSRFSGH